MTKSQAEIRQLVLAKDPRVWPLYGKRIIEWREGEARAAARQIVDSMGCCEDDDPVSADNPDDSSVPAPGLNQGVARSLAVSTGYPDDSSPPIPEAKRAIPIPETPEKRALFEKTVAAIQHIVGDLEEISSKRLVVELARIEGGPRKGYRRVQFERLFQSSDSSQPRSRAEGKGGAQA